MRVGQNSPSILELQRPKLAFQVLSETLVLFLSHELIPLTLINLFD
jgi:hypothetical protein